ncbi:MAG: hypothetical protein AAF517_21120 [Planctomycetota bacterium]
MRVSSVVSLLKSGRSLCCLALALSLSIVTTRSPAAEFIRGDANLDGALSVADLEAFGCLFFCAGGFFSCMDSADVNDDGKLDLVDFVDLYNELLIESTGLPAPFPNPGEDPTDDDLECNDYTIPSPPVSNDELIRLGHVDARPGDFVQIPVEIEITHPVATMHLAVEYDPAVFTPLAQDPTSLPDARFFRGTPLEDARDRNYHNVFFSAVDVPDPSPRSIYRVGFTFFIQPFQYLENSVVFQLLGTIPENAEPGREMEFRPVTFDAGPYVMENEIVGNGYRRSPGLSSGSLTVLAPVEFVRGDSNVDGQVDISDAIHALSYLFLGGASISCDDAADVNDNGQHDLSDSISLLAHLFLGGLGPRAPWPDCGVDPSDDPIECEGHVSCLP